MEKIPVSAVVATQAVTPPVAAAPQTWWERITHFWHSLKWQGLSDGVGGTAGMMRVGLWFSVGFAVGFLFKKYFKTALVVLVVTILLIKGLEFEHIITIDWASFRQMVGLESTAGVKSGMSNILELVKDNIVVCVAAVGGFLVGHQLG